MESATDYLSQQLTAVKSQALRMNLIDRKILMLLQNNASQPVADIARKVKVGNALLATHPTDGRNRNHPQTCCLADPKAVGVDMSVFVGAYR